MPNALMINMEFIGGELPPMALLVNMDFIPPPAVLNTFTYGKDVVLKLGGVNVICFKSIVVTFDGDDVDVSDSCSGGFRELSKNPAIKGVTFAVSGVAKKSFLRNAMITPGGRMFSSASLEWPGAGAGLDGAKITGDFYLSDYSEDVMHDNVIAFTGTLKTSSMQQYRLDEQSVIDVEAGELLALFDSLLDP